MRGLSASWVITGVDGAEPIRDGAVVLDAEQCILAVGPARELRAEYQDADWKDHAAVLTPGLVNAHTHLELSAMRGKVPGGAGFGPWVSAMIGARAKLLPEQDFEAIDAGVGELLRHGTAAVGEVTNSLAAVEALSTAPMLGRVFHEVYGLGREAGEVMREVAGQQRAEITSWPQNLSYAPAPHTLFTMHPATAQAVVNDARQAGQVTSLHLCEHAAERAFLADGGGPFAAFLKERKADPVEWEPPGLDPVSYAIKLGLLGPDTIVVHLTDARPEEIVKVAESGSAVVLCPRSNLHIEVRLPPLTAILKAGIKPGLGTDSLASNASLDVLAEARALHQRFPTVAPGKLLSMATSYGADALGVGHLVGRLAPGLSPGVLAFEHDGQPPEDPERFILSAADPGRRMLVRPAVRMEEKS